MKTRGFTLVELLVVVVIIAMLIALVMRGVLSAKDAGQVASCVNNLRQIGGGIAAYAADHDNNIPYGPGAAGGSGANNLYPATGNPTSLISLQDGRPVGLGLLLDVYLARTPKVLFCPGTDHPVNAAAELAKVGKGQAQGGYYYRHGGNTALYDLYGQEPPTPPIKIGFLGDNRRGKPVRALVIDTTFLCPPELKSFGISPVANHRGLVSNVLYTDGHVVSHSNDDKRYSVNVQDFSQVRASFDKILGTLETADAEQ